MIYHSDELHQFTAVKTHSMETRLQHLLRRHLLWLANWVRLALRPSTPSSFSASVAIIRKPGGTPDPVEVEDSQNHYDTSAFWSVPTDMTHTRRCGPDLPSGALVH